MHTLKTNDLLFDTVLYHAPLSHTIIKAYNALILVALCVPQDVYNVKLIDGTAGKVSVSDIIAYQIGWGSLVLSWYKAGIEGVSIQMPGGGFATWDYTGLATLFYRKYQGESVEQQLKLFHATVRSILVIVERESQSNNLDALGIWAWCTLQSGKQWPLSKWITVNTASPYKRAARLIKAASFPHVQ